MGQYGGVAAFIIQAILPARDVARTINWSKGIEYEVMKFHVKKS